jgi:hypothetical protein
MQAIVACELPNSKLSGTCPHIILILYAQMSPPVLFYFRVILFIVLFVFIILILSA